MSVDVLTMILYITKATETNIGARLHYQAILELAGKENVFTVTVSPVKAPLRAERYISYGKCSKAARILRLLQGNMMFIGNKIIQELCDIIKEYGITTVFIEDSVFGNLVRKIKKRYPSVKVFSFYHDIKANLYAQWSKSSNWLGKIEFSIGIRQEKINQQYCDVNLVFNQRDADLFHAIYHKYPEGKVALPAPVPLLTEEYKHNCTKAAEKKTLLFVGKKYYPNIVGIQWFYEKVLPHLKGNFEFQIVGRGLEYLKEELSDPHVNVVGGVESLDDYYKNADIVIAPLFDGGGMKSKTVEAVSFGKTFVGTEESLFGFWEEMDEDIRGKSVFQCNTPEEWIGVLNALTEKEIPKFNAKLYELFLQKFSYDAMKKQLAEYLIGREK